MFYSLNKRLLVNHSFSCIMTIIIRTFVFANILILSHVGYTNIYGLVRSVCCYFLFVLFLSLSSLE